MKKTLLTVLFALVAPLAAQDDDKPQGSPIKAEMKKFDKALDAVVDFLKEPKGDAPMAEVAAAQVALHQSKLHPPRTAEEQPEEKRAEFVRDYRIAINAMIRSVLDLEDALLKKDFKAASKVVEELEAQKKTGHKTYKGRRRRGSRGE